MKQLYLIIICISALAACKHDPIELPEKAGTTTSTNGTDTLINDTSGCDTANVTYTVTIRKVLQDNCLRCHGVSVYMTKGSGYNLDDYAVLKSEVDNGNVAKAINHAPGAVPMPLDQTEKISDCEIRKMMIWIAMGAPQN